MKIIDKKGKLFEKISIIDVLIVGVLCLGAIFLVNMFKEEAIIETSKKEAITFTFEAKDVTPSFYDAIEVGTDVYNSSRNYYVGQVEEVIKEPFYVWTEDLEKGLFYVKEDPSRMTVHIVIKSQGTSSEYNIYAGQELIKIGHIFPIKGKGFAANGVVIDIKEASHEKP